MMNKKAEFQEDLQFQVLRRLQEEPGVSQRSLAKEFDISLGSINFCFKALIEKGWVKIHNFSQSKHKLGYAYLLTPSGITEKSKMTAQFLKRKVTEYEALKEEIERLKAELPTQPQ